MNMYCPGQQRIAIPTRPGFRRGITIVEVLTSIVVAVIGVAGVLVLIPFGIRQAETGLDLEESTSIAENAISRFQIEGYGKVGLNQGQDSLPWIDATDGTLIDLEFDTNVGYYLIDPLWLASQPNNLTVMDLNNMFVGQGTEFRDGVAAGNDTPPFQPRHVSLVDFAQSPSQSINLANAVRIFVSPNELQFAVDKYPDGSPNQGLDIPDLLPPQPYIDLDAAGQPLRRQAVGSISWSAIAVPKRFNLDQAAGIGIRAEGFDFHVLAYKDRNFSPAPSPGGVVDPERDPRFRFAQLVVDPANPTRIYGTGTIVLDSEVDIRSDEWVMLVNYDLNSPPDPLMPSPEVQVAFFRVIGSAPNENAITIDGSDFIIREFLADGTTPNRSPTYVVYLPDVVSVFKRQLVLESESSLGRQ